MCPTKTTFKDSVHPLHVVWKGSHQGWEGEGPANAFWAHRIPTILFLSARTRRLGWPWTPAPNTTRSPLDASAAWGKSLAQKSGWDGASFGSEENILQLGSDSCLYLCEYTKNHRIVPFKRVTFMIHELYLNKALI